MDEYRRVLEAKAKRAVAHGPEPQPSHSRLFPFQRRIAEWAIRAGSAAIFADCGLGKTLMQVEWARQIARHAGRPVLLLAPLAVGEQTCDEAATIGVDAAHDGSTAAVVVANYERLHRHDPADYGGIVLDESSILKGMLGTMRQRIVDFARRVEYRLACTATPAPNELIELLNHADYLGIMTVAESKATWFVNDEQHTQSWRLKGHAGADFWRWVSTWAVALRDPRDIGIPDGRYSSLPPYEIHVHETAAADSSDPSEMGMLFDRGGLSSLRASRARSLANRVAAAAALVAAEPAEKWCIWTERNDESAALMQALPRSAMAVELRGSMDVDDKEWALRDFSIGIAGAIVTKPSIAGHGLNWQHCARMIFVGMSYSFEQWYQAVRRCWRFGQHRVVHVHVIVADDNDRHVLAAVRQKEAQAMQVFDFVTPEGMGGTPRRVASARVGARRHAGSGWVILEGDSATALSSEAQHSVGLSVFSPPFPCMYAYTDDERDMGNVSSVEEMIAQYRYVARALLPLTMPGRSCIVHIVQGVAQKQRDGYVGLKDFRGALIACMVAEGWQHYGEIVIDTNPQAKAVRTEIAA